MKISVLKGKSKAISEFEKEEWKIWDRAHFGQEVPSDGKIFRLKVTSKGKIVGISKINTERGVAKIQTLLVTHTAIRKGIGRKLIEKAEEIAKANNCHKLTLTTGNNWEAVKFYEAVGYKKEADLPNHFLHVDFIHMTKYI